MSHTVLPLHYKILKGFHLFMSLPITKQVGESQRAVQLIIQLVKLLMLLKPFRWVAKSVTVGTYLTSQLCVVHCSKATLTNLISQAKIISGCCKFFIRKFNWLVDRYGTEARRNITTSRSSWSCIFIQGILELILKPTLSHFFWE